MKLNLDKKFKPIEMEPEDEIFPNGFFKFNITKLIAHIHANPNDFQLEDVDLEPFSDPSPNLNETTIQNANLLNPIILAEISPSQFNVIDGNHRVEKARRLGIKKLPAYKVFSKQHCRFLISKEAYEKYVEYWNSKTELNEL